MRKVLSVFIALLLLCSCVLPAYAANGNVTYTGNSGKFIFTPGSEYSPTDVFPNFKDVMPGDSLTQTITIKNKASNKVKIKVYMRALGAHPDSEEFLSKLRLQVQKSANNTMAYMFDAQANETAQLTDWVLLGTLYSGGEVNLNVILDVPVELDNQFQEKAGYLDWQFKIEEFEIEPDDPKPPKTGDETPIWLWVGLLAGSGAAVILLIVFGRRKKEEA